MKKTILALSIFCVSNAALAESYYFRNPVHGMMLLNVVDGEDAGEEVSDEVVLEEGDDALCQDLSGQFNINRYSFISGDIEEFYTTLESESPDGIVHNRSGNDAFLIEEMAGNGVSAMIGELPNSIRDIVFPEGFTGTSGGFTFSSTTASSYDYCGSNMSNMVITYGEGGIEDPEESTDFEGYSYSSPYFSKVYDAQCAVDVTSKTTQGSVKVTFATTSGFANSYPVKANSNGEATLEVVSVHNSLSATLDNGNSQGIPAYIDNNTAPEEVRGVYFDENNYYAVLRDDEDNIVSNHAVVDGHTETIYTYEVGNYVDRVTAPEDYPDADRMDRHEIILVGSCANSGGGVMLGF